MELIIVGVILLLHFRGYEMNRIASTIAKCIAAIVELNKAIEWRYFPTASNPADILFRGTFNFFMLLKRQPGASVLFVSSSHCHIKVRQFIFIAAEGCYRLRHKGISVRELQRIIQVVLLHVQLLNFGVTSNC